MLHREVEERDRERELNCAPHNEKTEFHYYFNFLYLIRKLV